MAPALRASLSSRSSSAERGLGRAAIRRKNGSGSTLPGERPHRGERRSIGPVEIVEGEQERRILGEPFDVLDDRFLGDELRFR